MYSEGIDLFVKVTQGERCVCNWFLLKMKIRMIMKSDVMKTLQDIDVGNQKIR